MVDRLVDSLRSLVIDYGMQIIVTVFIGVIIVIGKIVVNRFWSRSITKKLIPNYVGNLLKALMNVVAFLLFFVITTTVWGVEGTWVIGTFGLLASYRICIVRNCWKCGSRICDPLESTL